MVWGSVISGAAGIIGGALGGDSAKDAYRSRERKFGQHLGEAKRQFSKVSPEMLSLYRGLMPELRSDWREAKGQLRNIDLAARQRISDEGDKTTGDIEQGLRKAMLWSSSQQANLKRAQQADEQRRMLEVDSMMAGRWSDLKAAEAASKASGRIAAAGGIGGVGQQLGSYDEKMAQFYLSPKNEQPHSVTSGSSIGALAGALWNAAGSTDWGNLFGGISSDQETMNWTGMSGSSV